MRVALPYAPGITHYSAIYCHGGIRRDRYPRIDNEHRRCARVIGRTGWRRRVRGHRTFALRRRDDSSKRRYGCDDRDREREPAASRLGISRRRHTRRSLGDRERGRGAASSRVFPLATIKELMGHADVKTTLRYVDVNAEQKRDAIALAFGARHRDSRSTTNASRGSRWQQDRNLLRNQRERNATLTGFEPVLPT
jgi:hypothetical protein